ncbi:MAG: VanZ family protein [Rhodocyclaceae bacterium]|nr:VanZ family protein [Rhodocyclaceae bacterium]
MLLLWLLTVAVIYYGSLYPFQLRPLEHPDQAVAYLLTTVDQWDRPGDLISNVLLYIPCGLFGMLALRRLCSVGIAIVAATVVGTLISGSVELLQFYAGYRNPTFGDIYANAIGSLIGALAGLAGSSRFHPGWLAPLVKHPRSGLLLVLWLGGRLYPYAPTIDLHKYWHALKPLIVSPSLPPLELFRYSVMWLFIAALIQSCYGALRWRSALLLFALAFFAAKVLITDNVIKPADIVGFVLAFALWLVFFAPLHLRYLMLAVPFLALLAVTLLAPFSFSDEALRGYGWIPFKSLMNGSIGVNVQSFCEKTALYGGMIWLLARGGFSFAVATLLTASALSVASYLQIFLPGRSAEITDVVICLLMGVVFAALPRPAPPSRHDE